MMEKTDYFKHLKHTYNRYERSENFFKYFFVVTAIAKYNLKDIKTN